MCKLTVQLEAMTTGMVVYVLWPSVHRYNKQLSWQILWLKCQRTPVRTVSKSPPSLKPRLFFSTREKKSWVVESGKWDICDYLDEGLHLRHSFHVEKVKNIYGVVWNCEMVVVEVLQLIDRWKEGERKKNNPVWMSWKEIFTNSGRRNGLLLNIKNTAGQSQLPHAFL